MSRGVTVMLVMVFMGVFAMVVTTLASYLLTQANVGRAKFAREQAFSIAEAGLEYYRWFLAHNPQIIQTGQGIVSPYEYIVNDPEGGEIGTATITVTPKTACGVIQSIEIQSQGTSDADTRFKRMLFARYTRPSVAEYSNILNANVWAGSDRVITGPYFSNGGIRMDATTNSTVSSAVFAWTCDSSFGCTPTASKPGVWGSGTNQPLWKYPSATFDFPGIATNFAQMKTYASTQGIMLNPTNVKVAGVQQGNSFPNVGGTEQRGFRIVLRSDNTIDVYRVMGSSQVKSKHIDNLGQWVSDYHTVDNQPLIGNFAIPQGCPVIYAEAKVWLEGVVGNKTTLVAADEGSFAPDIILNNNITYGSGTGSSGLTAIAEHSVIIPLVSPDMMTIRGIFVAQTGYVGRNFYQIGGQNGVPQSQNSFVKQSTLTTIGTIVSNQRVGTKWSCGGIYCSGYENRIDTYDRLLALDPPPFTPFASPDYKFIVWKEQ